MRNDVAAGASRTHTLLAAAIAMVAASCSSPATPSVTPGTSSLSSRAPTASIATSVPSPGPSGRLVEPVASIQVGSLITETVAGPTGIWAVMDTGIMRIDPDTNTVAASYPLEQTPDGYGLAVGKDAVWVSDFDHDKVYRLDPATGKRVASIDTPPGPGVITIVDGAVWVGNHHAGSISRIDPTANRIVNTITVGDSGPGGPISIVPIGGSLWVGYGGRNVIARVDAKARKTIGIVGLPTENGVPIPVDATHIWVLCGDGEVGGVAVLDPTDAWVASTIDIGGAPGYGALVNDGVVWVPVLTHTSGRAAGTILGIDTVTKAVVDRLTVAGGAPDDILTAFGSGWLELGLTGTIERVPLTAFTAPP